MIRPWTAEERQDCWSAVRMLRDVTSELHEAILDHDRAAIPRLVDQARQHLQVLACAGAITTGGRNE